MSVTATAFPVPGEGFRDKTGKVRSVARTAIRNGTVFVFYSDGGEESYPPPGATESSDSPADVT